jgi:hypothetical protein
LWKSNSHAKNHEGIAEIDAILLKTKDNIKNRDKWPAAGYDIHEQAYAL